MCLSGFHICHLRQQVGWTNRLHSFITIQIAVTRNTLSCDPDLFYWVASIVWTRISIFYSVGKTTCCRYMYMNGLVHVICNESNFTNVSSWILPVSGESPTRYCAIRHEPPVLTGPRKRFILDDHYDSGKCVPHDKWREWMAPGCSV